MSLAGVKKGDTIFVRSTRGWSEDGDYRVLSVGRKWLTALNVRYDGVAADHLSRRFNIETGLAESAQVCAYRNRAAYEQERLTNQQREQIRRWAARSIGRNDIDDAAPELIARVHAMIFPDGVAS